MGKPNGNGFTVGHTWKEEFQTKFIPYLMDCIGDADLYQHMYDTIFNTRRCIKGEKTRELSDKSELTGHIMCADENDNLKIKNIHVLYCDWYNDEDKFQKTLKTLIGIYNNDPNALKERDAFMNTKYYDASWTGPDEALNEAEPPKEVDAPKEVESVAAYTPNATITGNNKTDPVIQSMNNTPEQNVFNSSIKKEDDKERITFNSQFFEDNRTQEPQNEASFIQRLPDGRIIFPDGTVYIDPNVLMANRTVYPMAPMTPEQQAAVQNCVPIQYGGTPYVPEFVSMDPDVNQIYNVEAPEQATPEPVTENAAPGYIIDNRILEQDDTKIPYCEYVMDSGSVLAARTKFNNDNIFIPTSKMATGLIKRKRVIKEIYKRTGMVSALFSFKYLHDQNHFGIWMCTCNNTWLTIDYVNGAYSFTEEAIPSK